MSTSQAAMVGIPAVVWGIVVLTVVLKGHWRRVAFLVGGEAEADTSLSPELMRAST